MTRARFLLSHPAHFIALGFGTGLSPKAPGTVGTLLALPLYLALSRVLGPFSILILCAALFAVGVWACGRTARDLGVHDHGSITWDEIVAFLMVLSFTPATWFWWTGAFVAFRFFDIVKPPPIRRADARVKGGFGVMLDDLLAAGYSLLLLAVVKSILD